MLACITPTKQRVKDAIDARSGLNDAVTDDFLGAKNISFARHKKIKKLDNAAVRQDNAKRFLAAGSEVLTGCTTSGSDR